MMHVGVPLQVSAQLTPQVSQGSHFLLSPLTSTGSISNAATSISIFTSLIRVPYLGRPIYLGHVECVAGPDGLATRGLRLHVAAQVPAGLQA